jgi:peptidoglycan/LPS O-acetylase OafA/YrhL
MNPPRRLHRAATLVLSILMMLVGVAIAARTLAHGGGPAALGVLVGLLFVAAGGARLYLQTRMDDG